MFTASSPSQLSSFYRTAACALVLCATGCILPISYTEGASPPLAGQYRRADGKPVAGERVAVSPEWKDSTCSRAAQRATTDSAGRFQLDRTTIRHRWVLVFPPFERFWNSYWVCAGTADSTLHPLYAGRGPLNRQAPLDSLSCLEWEWQGRTRSSCSGARVGRVGMRDVREPDHTVVDGGHWTDGNASGFFRVIRTLESTRVRGYRRPVEWPHAYVQWIDSSGVGSPNTVRQTVELELEPNVNSLSSIELRQQSGLWQAWLQGTRKQFWNAYARAELTFELGPPGKVARVRDR